MAHPPESIRALSDRLDHDVHDVHDDLHLLAEYEVIHFEADGRAKQPYVPCETVQIEVELGQEDPPTPEPESPGDWQPWWTSSSHRRSPLAGMADEFDLEMDPVREVRPPRLPVFGDEQETVIGEQRDVVVDSAVVPVEVRRERGDALGHHGEDLPQVADQA